MNKHVDVGSGSKSFEEIDHKARSDAKRSDQRLMLVRMGEDNRLVDLDQDSIETLEQAALSLGADIVAMRNDPSTRHDPRKREQHRVVTGMFQTLNREVIDRRKLGGPSSRLWLSRFHRTAVEKLPAELLAEILKAIDSK